MPFGKIIGWRKTENVLGAKSERFSGAQHVNTEKSPFTSFGKRRGFLKSAQSRSSRQVFFFLVQEKPVLVRITSEGPSKENRLEEII